MNISDTYSLLGSFILFFFLWLEYFSIRYPHEISLSFRGLWSNDTLLNAMYPRSPYLKLYAFPFLAYQSYLALFFSIALYVFTRADITKYHRLGDLNDKFIFSHFWRLEIQDQDVSKCGFSWDFSPWLSDDYFFLCLFKTFFSMHIYSWCLFVCPNLFFL